MKLEHLLEFVKLLKQTDSEIVIKGVNQFDTPFKIYVKYNRFTEKFVTFYKWDIDNKVRGFKEIKSIKLLVEEIRDRMNWNEDNIFEHSKIKKLARVPNNNNGMTTILETKESVKQ